MCGVFGLVRKEKENVLPLMIKGLRAMEYRGYDSSGMSFTHDQDFITIKAMGALKNLDLPEGGVVSQSAIGHIRWATHGVPCLENTHPFVTQNFALVHNGIVDNTYDLQQCLSTPPLGSTDSEVVAHLLEHYFTKEGSAFLALECVLEQLKGQWGFAVSCRQNPHAVLFARQGSPIIIGYSDSGLYVASDVVALPSDVNRITFLEDGDYGFISDQQAVIYHNKKEVRRPRELFEPIESQDSHKGFSSFFLQEIAQSAHVSQNIITHTLGEDFPKSFVDMFHQIQRMRPKGVHLVACGSSYYAAMMACVWLRTLSCIPASAYVASEYNWQCAQNNLIVFISQSGETADILRLFHKKTAAKTLGVVNREKSALCRTVDRHLLLHAGTEKSVAATKSFSAQITLLLIVSLAWASEESSQILWDEIFHLPKSLQKLEEFFSTIQGITLPKGLKTFVFISHEDMYPIAIEGSLKMKELSYLPSVAHTFVNAPLLHLSHETFAVILLNKGDLPDAHHIIAQALTCAPLLVISNGPTPLPNGCVHIHTPPCDPHVFPILATPFLQILAHTVAQKLGKNIDQPRNLAKSVTVE